MKIVGVEWDAGNWPKCGKHGVSQAEIEYVLATARFRVPDPDPAETRFRTAGKTEAGRHVFVVYTYREDGARSGGGGGTFIRPISARYMHGKEVKSYEQYQESLA